MRVYRTGAGFGGRQTTSAVKALIIANVAVFVAQTFLGGGLTGRIGVVERLAAFVPQDAIFGFQIWRFATYMFLHADFWHIGLNMFILWMFGSQLEAFWGRRTFLVYYFVCGVGAAAFYGAFKLFGIESSSIMLGASGAVFGLLLAYGLTFPDNIIFVFMILPMKAKYAVLVFGFIELLSMGRNTGVAHLAHLGGMVAGFLFLRLTAPGLARGGGLDAVGRAWRRFRARSRMRVVRPDEKPRGNGGTDEPPSREQQRIDAILDKISREGLQSLTDEEQEILRRAGRR